MNSIVQPEEDFAMSPEMVTVARTYLETCDIAHTAQILGIEKEKVAYYLNKPECKRFVDTVFLDAGYLNRHRIQEALTEIIKMKLEEMRESEMGSNKDIADLLMMAHKIGQDFRKETAPSVPTTQTNVQINNGGENYKALMDKLIK